MLDIIVSILISLNINYTIVDENRIQLSNDQLNCLTSSTIYRNKELDGTIHDIHFEKDDRSLDDLIVVPDVDPFE